MITEPTPPDAAFLDPVLRERLTDLQEEGHRIFERFDLEVRQHTFHPFMPGDYEMILQALLPLRAPGLRFLEWGSGSGVITIMADLIGFEACGIEIDPNLVRTARDLAARHGSNARFAHGSFLPTGYQFRSADGDTRLGTIEEGASGYLELEHPLEDFDVVYGYPWDGEGAVMLDVMQRYGSSEALLMLHSGGRGIQLYRAGRRLN